MLDGCLVDPWWIFGGSFVYEWHVAFQIPDLEFHGVRFRKGMHAHLVMSVGLCLSYVPIGWAWGDTHMMMKSVVVFLMCCFSMLCYCFLLLSEKLALGVPVILPSMALTVHPVSPGKH